MMPHKQHEKKRSVLPIIFLIFCFVVSASAGALLASSGLFDSKKPVITPDERKNMDTELIKAKDKTTVLIMGVDVRKDDVGRSDTMMVATVDPEYDQASILSVPRDTRVRIPGYGFDKINAAYAYGGEPLSERTIENLLGIDIDHYVIINTRSFVKIIDAIGGVDIDVEKRMRYEDPWDDDGGLFINLFPGLQHMDGKTAVTYVRYRDSEGDIGRIKRQQKFMAACMDKVTSPEIITHIPSILREVLAAVDTDMTFKQLLEIAGAVKEAQQNGLTTDMVPGYPLYIDEISYWIPNVQELRFMMAEGLGVSMNSDLKKRAEKDDNEYKESLPSSAGEISKGAENIGNPRNSYRSSENSRDTGETLRDVRENARRSENSRGSRETETSRENSTARRNSSTYYDERTSRDDRTSSTRRNYDDANLNSRSNYDNRSSNYENNRQTLEDRTSNYNDRSNYESRSESITPRIERRTVPENYEDDTPTRGDTFRTR